MTDVIRELNLDALKKPASEANKAMKEGRLPDEFYDDLLLAADQRHGGRMQ